MERNFSSGGSNASADSVGDVDPGSAGSSNSHKEYNTKAIIAHRNGQHFPQMGEYLSAELKSTYRSLYIVAKQLDSEKKEVKSISQLFHHSLEEKRAKLVQLCKQIMFKDYQSVGKKAREIMWRKGYYEFIAFVKKNWTTEFKDLDDPSTQENLLKLERFLCAGVSNYKRIASNMEEIYDLDLKYLLDFSIINDGEFSNGDASESFIQMQPIDKSIEAISFALDTIHSSLLSLGDLHRYFLDFRVGASLKITKQQTAKYYHEAFKLNPAIGMAQNQLGTLYYGQNFFLDSIYHYLYSLVSIIPFELSENNVCRLFATHTEYLERMDPNKIEFSLQDFFARFYLIVDIFFFDKEVPDFNSICHCVLVDLRKILYSKHLQMAEPSIFQIVSILFFCLSKLKMINSPKVYSLNAFLVAICSDLMDSCIVNLEQTILARAAENEKFQKMYAQKFDEFDVKLRKSCIEYKKWMTAIGENAQKSNSIKVLTQKDCSSDSRESQYSNGEYTHKILDANGSNKHMNEINEKHIDPISTRSSDEAKESDLKTPLSCKSKRRGLRLRRRRRKVAQSDDSSCYDTESELDTDFSTDDEDYTDLSSNFDTDFSDVEPGEQGAEEPEDGDFEEKKEENEVASGFLKNASKESLVSEQHHNDSDDVVIEEEHLIFLNDQETNPNQRNNSQDIDSEELLRSFEVLQLSNKEIIKNAAIANVEEPPRKSLSHDENNVAYDPNDPPKKLKYRHKYTKVDPNIIVDFAIKERTMRALKILFDWLRINHEILFGCYHSNPEFIHKIMKLMNYCNIDIFTRKVYFEREFLTCQNVREGLTDLFDMRCNIPLSEDFVFKNFDIFQGTQITLDWETTIRDKVSSEEESIIRILKMVDFGFFICKLKKFNYRFCVKSRRFTENTKKKREEKKSSNRRRERRTARNAARKRTEGRTRRYSDRKNGIVRKSYTSNEEKDTVEEGKKFPRKGYLRNRNAEKSGGTSNAGATSASTTTNSFHCDKVIIQSSSGADEERSETISKKCVLMGKLWLQNEVESLEHELRKSHSTFILTPFLVVDTKALIEHTGIIKNLVKSNKFIVLIPNAVFNELDELKKRSENTRNVIRWLEQEFKQGNRRLRAQRDNENSVLPLLKIPRKLDRESSVFIQIAQMCNHLVNSHSDPCSSEFKNHVVTYLYGGETLYDRHRHSNQNNFSFSGILDSIPVRYEQIANFYEKFKANKK